MPAYTIPSWTSPAGQLYCALQGMFAKELDFGSYPFQWPKTTEDVLKRFLTIAALFDVKMERLYTMPLELINNVGEHWDMGFGNQAAPTYSSQNWPTDGYWVVYAGKHVLCFELALYPSGGPSISFSNYGNTWRFGGYGQMPIGDFFNILFDACGWGDNTKAKKVAERLGGHLGETIVPEVAAMIAPRIGLNGLNDWFMNQVFA